MQGTGELLSSRLGLTLRLLTALLLTTLMLFSSAPAHGAASYTATYPRRFRFLTALTPTTRPSDADTFTPSR